MIRDDITYHRPSTPDDVSALLLSAGPGAVVIGGGTMVVPQLTRGERRATDVVDLRGLGIDQVVVGDDYVEIGAMVTYGTILRSAPLPGATALLQKAADVVTGGSQIRNLGTLGGSVAYANPASDVPGVMVALGAQMRVAGPHGPRQVPADGFFLDAHKADLGPAELLIGMRIPTAEAATGYIKIKSASSGWPVVTASAVVTGASAHVTIGAAQAVPVRVDVSSFRDRDRWDFDGMAEAVRSAVTDPWHDSQATASYRKHVAGVMARRAVERSTS